MKWRKIVEKGRIKVSETVAIHRAEHRRRLRRKARGVRQSGWAKTIMAVAMADLLLGFLLR